MLRKLMTLSTLAAVCLGAYGFANAECTTCNQGCGPVAGCPGGNCFGNLLGGLHQSQTLGGPCLTCDNIWDDYCATKRRCLPLAKYPFQNQGCGGCGACSSCCNPGVGVGIYGKCLSGGCATGCDSGCDSCSTGCGVGLLHKLFKPAAPAAVCDAGCSDCASAGPAPMAMPAPAAPVYQSPSAVPSQPEAVPVPPMTQPEQPSARMTPQVPVPPAPASARIQKKGSVAAFSWLQKALKTK